jgi:uncharacterized integral membrane protein
MKILGPLIFTGLIVLGVFTLANWDTLNTPANLSFLIFHLEAPLGIVLLGAIAAFVVLFTGYILILRTAMLMDARRHERELRSQQKLAEQAEASRLSELRNQLEQSFAELRDTEDTTRKELGTRLDGMEQTLRNIIEESGRSLSAYIGEVEDKLDHGSSPPAV